MTHPEHRWKHAALPDWAVQTPGITALMSESTDIPGSCDRCDPQRSLERVPAFALPTGELHNNVRMTRGKAILKDAIARHARHPHRPQPSPRFDGNDPNSYGGLLWCMGCSTGPRTGAGELGRYPAAMSIFARAAGGHEAVRRAGEPAPSGAGDSGSPWSGGTGGRGRPDARGTGTG